MDATEGTDGQGRKAPVVGTRKGDLCEKHNTVRGGYGICWDCKRGRKWDAVNAYQERPRVRRGHLPGCDDPACVGDCR
jgi:hypothetical protein